MLRTLRFLSLFLLAFNACRFVHAETLTFNDLTSPSDGDGLPGIFLRRFHLLLLQLGL